LTSLYFRDLIGYTKIVEVIDMPGTKRGARKAIATKRAKYGTQYFKKIGKNGGKTTARRYFGKK